jgi:hypothetical protein
MHMHMQAIVSKTAKTPALNSLIEPPPSVAYQQHILCICMGTHGRQQRGHTVPTQHLVANVLVVFTHVGQKQAAPMNHFRFERVALHRRKNRVDAPDVLDPDHPSK